MLPHYRPDKGRRKPSCLNYNWKVPIKAADVCRKACIFFPCPFVDSQALIRQAAKSAPSKVMRGLLLGWTRKIHTDISPTPSLNITGVKKQAYEIWLQISNLVEFQALWFRNLKQPPDFDSKISPIPPRIFIGLPTHFLISDVLLHCQIRVRQRQLGSKIVKLRPNLGLFLHP